MGRPYFIHLSPFSAFLSPPPHHVTALIRNMLTHCLARISAAPLPPPLIFTPFHTSQHNCLSCVARSLSPSLLHLPLPPSPSFWWVGSSEVVAVCIAKGNVSSTHRKMGQNITTLPAHAQWLTHSAEAICMEWIRSLCPLISSAMRECSHFSLLSFLINYWRHTTAHGYVHHCCNQYGAMWWWSGAQDRRGEGIDLSEMFCSPKNKTKKEKKEKVDAMNLSPFPSLSVLIFVSLFYRSICQTLHTRIISLRGSRTNWGGNRKYC